MNATSVSERSGVAFFPVAPHEESAEVTQWTDITLLEEAGWWVDAAHATLRLPHLPENWDGFGSPPPDARVVVLALYLLRLIGEFQAFLGRPHIAPTSGGGIGFEWTYGQREIELEILPDQTVEYLKAEADQPVAEGSIQAPHEVGNLVAWLLDS